ncbi:MAG TPA: dephospho-CoA kinase [Acidimicrobiales bacterium]|nr:dephospho-CoA kinase [Acidimicrobiales bacterium]
MKRVAIAGGIGAGKSTVTARLTTLGFSVVDADIIARRVVEQGQPAWRAVVDAFGSAVLTPEGDIDRKFLADVVFHDASALRRLNHITHGYIGAEMRAELDALGGDVAFVAIPLYRREHRDELGLSEVWAIAVRPDTALERLVTLRGMDVDDARSRIAAQMSNDDLGALADRVIDNDGTEQELYASLDEAIEALVSRD